MSKLTEFFRSFQNHRNGRLKLAVAALAVTLAPLAVTHPAAAGPAGPAIFAPDDTGTTTAVSADALMARATQRGELRIIVGMGGGFQPEGGLSDAAAATQRGRIAAGQEALMKTLVAPANVTRFETIPFVAMTVTPDDLRRLLSDSRVDTVEEDVAVPPTLGDSVPLVDTRKLWRRGVEGNGQSVAILDTGVRFRHLAFRDRSGRKAVASACFSSNSAISSSLCPNGNDQMIRRRNGRAGVDCDTAINGCGHGTHVAGIAAGFFPRNNGMARRADIVPIQVFSRFGSPNCGGNPPCALSFTSDQIKGLEQVMRWRNRYNIAAANMSLGGGQFFAPCDGNQPSQTAIIENLRSRGVATVIASGNSFFDGSVGAPACISSAITVGSTTKADDLSSFSNHATMVDVLAPGSSILSADADGNRRALRTLSGTSMATPHVAGAVALLKSDKPGASVDEIERALECTGKGVSRMSLPRPRISMFDALRELRNPRVPNRWGFFNDRQVNAWYHVLGNWTRVGRSMRVNATTPNIWYVAQSPFCTDEVVVTAVMARQDPDTSTPWNSGIMLSSQADANGNFSALWFAYNVNQNNETSVVIWEQNGVDGKSGSETATLLCSAGPMAGPALGERRRLRAIRLANGQLHFDLDGTRVCSAMTDTRFEYGKVGVAMAAPPSSPAHELAVFRVIMRALGGDGLASVDVAGNSTSGAAGAAAASSASGSSAAMSPAGAAAQ